MGSQVRVSTAIARTGSDIVRQLTRSAGLALACLMLGSVPAAEAALIRYEFTGHLNAPPGVTATPVVIVPPGATALSGFALVDSSVPDIYSDDWIARRPDAFLAFQMTGLVLPFVAGHVDDVENVVISNEHTGVYVSGPISGGGAGSALTLYGYFDNLAGDALPLGAASAIFPGFIEFRVGALGCLAPASECTSVTLDSLVGTVVPDTDPGGNVGEPGSMMLLALGALRWAARRRVFNRGGRPNVSARPG
jgi:hypothetical protein